MDNKPFAEVIESSLDKFLAQSWEWDAFPKFGSLVSVNGGKTTIFGCVTCIQTGSMDPMRYPFPYQKTEEELKAEQPQIFEFLKTTFSVKALGYRDDGGKINYTLPPKPAKIHAFIKMCSEKTSSDFFSDPDFLYLLFDSQGSITHFDDLLLSIFRQLNFSKKLNSAVLNTFCQTLSLLTGNDYRRMKTFLKRVEKNFSDYRM